MGVNSIEQEIYPRFEEAHNCLTATTLRPVPQIPKGRLENRVLQEVFHAYL